MAETADRLRRYLEDELGECRNEDLQDRLAELDNLASVLDEGVVSRDVQTYLPLVTRHDIDSYGFLSKLMRRFAFVRSRRLLMLAIVP
jgi:hypothetical protein